jgi:hypothetical protein
MYYEQDPDLPARNRFTHEFNLSAPTEIENNRFNLWTPRTLSRSGSPGQNGASERSWMRSRTFLGPAIFSNRTPT